MTNIASEYVIKSPPDGDTLLMGGASNAINMSLFANPPYDTLRDFEPVILCFKGANVLAVHPSLPARNLKELIALARAQPGKLNYATSGLGSSNHIGGELLRMMAKIDIQHIPYKGNNPALTDTHGRARAHALRRRARGAAARGIGAAARHRDQHARSARPPCPRCATFDESGVKGYEATNWFGLLAPAKTPREAVERLNRAVDGVMRSADFRERFVREGLDVGGRLAGIVRRVPARGDRQVRESHQVRGHPETVG